MAVMQPCFSLLSSEGPRRERLSGRVCLSGDAKQPDLRKEAGQEPTGLEVRAVPREGRLFHPGWGRVSSGARG